MIQYSFLQYGGLFVVMLTSMLAGASTVHCILKPDLTVKLPPSAPPSAAAAAGAVAASPAAAGAPSAATETATMQ